MLTPAPGLSSGQQWSVPEPWATMLTGSAAQVQAVVHSFAQQPPSQLLYNQCGGQLSRTVKGGPAALYTATSFNAFEDLMFLPIFRHIPRGTTHRP